MQQKTIRIAKDIIREVPGFSRFVLLRFQENRLTEVAASLTFTTLLALVPLMAVGFAMIAAFPNFDDAQLQLENFIFENFVPHAGDAVRDYLNTFRQNARKLTAVGLIGLAITAIMVLFTIERAFNRIFKVRQGRPMAMRLLAYWALLTIGPILFSLSLSLTSALVAEANQAGGAALNGPLLRLARIVPLLLAFLGYSIAFVAMPNREIRWRDAMIGGAVAAVLFELLKSLFGLYITRFPTYQAIYGAMSVLPILLLWIYLCWVVTLVGANVVAVLPDWSARRGLDLARAPRTGRLMVALGVLRVLDGAHENGILVRRRDLGRQVKAAPDDLLQVVQYLEKAGYIRETGRNSVILGRRADGVTIYDLMRVLHLDTRIPGGVETLGPEFADILDRMVTAERDVFSVSLTAVLRSDALSAGQAG